MRRAFPFPPVAVALTASWLLLLLAAGGGCAWTQEERDFYGRGWLNPRELDRPAPYRGPRPIGETTALDGSPAAGSPWATAPGGSRQ